MPITFQILSKKRPSAVYVRFREGRGTDARARTNLTINPEDWSAAKGKAKENNATAKALNTELENFRRRLTERLNRRTPGEQITTEWLKAFINPTEAQGEGLLSYFDSYIQKKETEAKQGKMTFNTVKKVKANRSLLERMQEDLQEVYSIQDVSLQFIAKFKDYCHSKGYAQNTIARAVKYIVTVCRDARKSGIQVHKDLDDIKEKVVKAKSIYLTLEELEKIQKCTLESTYTKAYFLEQPAKPTLKPTKPTNHLDNARDWLIISCFTGQRVSDFMRFTSDMVKTDKGKRLIEFTQVKTKKIMTIPLHPKVEAILQKNNGFPRPISDQRYNEYIKEVCKLAGIKEKIQGTKKDKETNRNKSGTYEKWELVSSHIGRRSFASNFFGTIPTSLLMFVTGHTTEAQFYAYIGKAERTKAFQLAEYW